MCLETSTTLVPSVWGPGMLGANEETTSWCLPPPACVPSVGAQTKCSISTVGSLPIVLASHKLFIKRNH